ncbi:MAG: hypothetical protein J4203_06370 [Candidatus Diapherotrites archaeon]|uniref:Uncharacterized protein n=1 Tax=Candidatus Iainarchaeum sp. TaxID=3101447 RepID=A0A8T4LKX4_9ARCH|nr:hypothetical protein [Candidatus Diapherotrites archaeon]
MDWRKIFTPQGLLFTVLFLAMVMASNQLNFSSLLGKPNQFFTFFQFIGPLAGGFLGPIAGALLVFAAQLVDAFLHGKALDLSTIGWLLPMVFASIYFGSRRNSSSRIISFAAILLFLLHPVGRTAWFYSLYWFIPVLCWLFRKHLFARSLGATFTAHAIGGALWVWTVPMTTEQWMALIPIVAYERLLFAAGISVSYIALNTLLSKAASLLPYDLVEVNPKYVLSREMLGKTFGMG